MSTLWMLSSIQGRSQNTPQHAEQTINQPEAESLQAAAQLLNVPYLGPSAIKADAFSASECAELSWHWRDPTSRCAVPECPSIRLKANMTLCLTHGRKLPSTDVYRLLCPI